MPLPRIGQAALALSQRTSEDALVIARELAATGDSAGTHLAVAAAFERAPRRERAKVARAGARIELQAAAVGLGVHVGRASAAAWGCQTQTMRNELGLARLRALQAREVDAARRLRDPIFGGRTADTLVQGYSAFLGVMTAPCGAKAPQASTAAPAPTPARQLPTDSTERALAMSDEFLRRSPIAEAYKASVLALWTEAQRVADQGDRHQLCLTLDAVRHALDPRFIGLDALRVVMPDYYREVDRLLVISALRLVQEDNLYATDEELRMMEDIITRPQLATDHPDSPHGRLVEELAERWRDIYAYE